MFVQRVSAESVTVSGTGREAAAEIKVPDTTAFAPGVIYDVLVRTQVPAGTDGTVLTVSNGAVTCPVVQRASGNYVRCRGLGWRRVLRLQWLDDPAHFLLLGARG